MYKIFDTPKNKYDIVNKEYVDKLLNIISDLQDKIIELENRISMIEEGSTIKVKNITINGPNIIYKD